MPCTRLSEHLDRNPRSLPPAVAELILVRPIQATLVPILAAAVAVGFVRCGSVLMVPQDEFISHEAYRFLSIADIHAIERLAIAVTAAKGLHSIHATRSDEVSVECGDPYHQDAVVLSFTAHRKNGHWVADKKSIGTSRPIIVE